MMEVLVGRLKDGRKFGITDGMRSRKTRAAHDLALYLVETAVKVLC